MLAIRKGRLLLLSGERSNFILVRIYGLDILYVPVNCPEVGNSLVGGSARC